MIILAIFLIMLIAFLIYTEVIMDIPKKNVIIINGSGCSGKDLFCQLVAEQYRTKIVSSARLPKEIAELYFGWTGTKTEKDRKMLSDLKDLMTEYDNIPFKDMCEEIELFLNDRNQFLFLHVREPEEIDKLRNKYPLIKTLLITRSGNEKIESNHADANVCNYNYDYVIKNDGSIDMYRKKALKLARYLDSRV